MKLTCKGQVTIPQVFRERFGLHPNTEVVFEEKNGLLVVRPKESKDERLQKWIGKTRGSANTGLTTDEIMKLTRGED